MEFRDEHGRRVRRSTKTGDRRSAELILADELRSVELRKLGIAAPSPQQSRMPIGDVIDAFIAQMNKDELTETHVYIVGLHLRKMERELGWKVLEDITRDKLRAYVEGPLAKLARSTRMAYVDAVRQMCKFAIEHEPPLMSLNPADGVMPRLRGKSARVERSNKRKRRPLWTPEIVALLNAVPEDAKVRWRFERERAPIYRLVMLATGYRRETLRAIRPEHIRIDCANPHISVPPELTKSGRGIDTPIRDPECLEILRERLRICAERPRGHRFADHPLAPVPSNAAFTADLKRAGIPVIDEQGRKVVFHSLRMTFCTQLGLAGYPLMVARDLMDHASVEITQRIYQHVGMLDSAEQVETKPLPAMLKLAGVA
jgi:integrase